MKYYLIYCFFFVCCVPGYSQYKVQHFTTENGLPSNGIKGMEWDESSGFLWIATEAGLVRYNGMAFETFDVKTNPELGSNRIVVLVKNAAGKILAGGQQGNLTLIKNNTASVYFIGADSAKYKYNHYSAIAASDTLFKKCFKNPWRGLYNFYNTVIASISDTACIVLTEGQLHYYSLSTQWPEVITTAPAGISALFKVDNRLFCLDARGYLLAFDVYRDQFSEEKLFQPDGTPFKILEKSSKLFWQPGMKYPVLLQEGKAWVIETGKRNQLISRQIASGLPENTLFNCVQYKEEGGYLFLGTDSKGIYVVHQSQLMVKQPNEANIDDKNSFYSQIALPDGNIITSDGSIIGDQQPRNNFNIGPGFLNHIFSLNDSVLFFCRADSMFEYNRYTAQKKMMFRIITYMDFSFVHSGGQLYYVSGGGVGIVREDKRVDFVKQFDQKNARILHPVLAIESTPGKLALATCDGLLEFDIQTRRIDTLLKIPSVCVRTLFKEGDYIFIGTYGGGFYVMKHGIIKAMPLDNNRSLQYTHCFIKDEEGFCWISTNNGLFKAKMSDMLDAYDRNLSQIYYHYLGKESGMETTEMNGGCTPCALRLKNGMFSFPTMDGMLWFHPQQVNISLPAGNIYIDKVFADGKQLYADTNEPIQFAENVSKIDITLALNAWCQKENLYIDYKLDDDDWLRVEMVSNEPRINLNKAAYGNHILRVRKLNGFGTNNYSSVTLLFSVATPFYHQWWFRILGLMCLLGIGYLVFKLRLHQYQVTEKKLSALVDQKTMDLNLKNIQLEKNNEIKTRLISVINHDIITPLKFMHYAGKALEDNKGGINREDELQTITEITQTAKDMEMLSSQILNWIIYQNPNERMQKEEFDLHILIEMVFRVLQFPAKLKSTNLRNEVLPHFVIYQYMEPLRVLIYNLVLNSINFTKEGSVTLRSNMSEGVVTIQVVDTGLGMTEDQVHNLMSDEKIIASANVDNKKGTGLGYMIIKDLLKMMDGTLSIKSEKNKGTFVSVSMR